ncbi:unnamed protein product [Urochloa humidicola]
MEPYRQGGASSSNPDAELEAHLQAMLLNAQQQQVLARAPPPLLLNAQQQQVLARAPPQPYMFPYPPQAPGMLPPHMFRHPPTATPDMRPLPHQQARSYFGDGEGFFPGAGYVSTVSASSSSSFGVNPSSSNFNVPAAATPSAAPRPSNLRFNAEEYHPNSHSASALPGAQRGGTDRFLREEVRSRLVQGQMVQDLVMSAESSPHVVDLLAEGDARVRQCVLYGIKPIVHNVMKHSVAGHAVFLQLLRACNGKSDDLKVIIDAVCNGKGKLMAAFDDNLGRIALEELIRMMAWNRPLCKRLILGLLVNERLLQESRGHVVLRHCFAMLPYEECSLIIEHALETIDEVLFSRFGATSLAAVCLENAEGDDLKNLEEMVLTRTSEIAKGKWSTCLLQYLLVSGSEHLKLRIVHRVAADILNLAMDEFGCYVVRACILVSTEALQHVLDAVLGLHRRELEELVLGRCSTYVVHNLLVRGKKFLPVLTKRLASWIEGMPVVVRRQKDAELVLLLIHELFPFCEGPGSASV